MLGLTRLHPFARSWFYNATAVRGALWWFRQSHSVTLTGVCHIQQQSHSVNYANQHSPFARRRHDFRQAAARRFKLHSPPLSFGKSFMKIRSAVPENGCLIFLTDRKKTKKNKKKQKKTKKNICKTYTHPPPTGRRLRKLQLYTTILLLFLRWGLHNRTQTFVLL